MKRGVSRRRGVRGGVREIYALLGGSGVRGRGRSVRRSRGGQYDLGRAFMVLGGSGVRGRSVRRSRSSSRGGGWRDEIMPEVYAVL